jgi:hypothetical protein
LRIRWWTFWCGRVLDESMCSDDVIKMRLEMVVETGLEY